MFSKFKARLVGVLHKIEARLVDGWRQFYKRASVWLAGVVSAIATIIAANQGIYMTLIGYLPKEGLTRILALAGLAGAVFIVPTITVLVKQKSVSGDKAD